MRDHLGTQSTVRRSASEVNIATEQAAGTPAATGARSGWSGQLREWLGNPLVVAIASAVLIYWVIPQVTRQWQNHQKALEIQTGLVSSMSQSASDAVISGRMLASRVPQGGPAATQRLFNEAVRNWSVQGSVAGAKLQAYFPHSDLGPAWGAYTNAVAAYLQLAARSGPDRATHVAEIRSYGGLPQTRPAIDWNVLATQDSGAAFEQNYAYLGLALLSWRNALIREVLDRHPAGF